MAGLKIEYRPAADLAPYAKNARTHSAEQIAQIAKSITEFGWTNPILVDETGGVIAGHGRLLAAASLGITEVPVISLAGLSDTKKRALILADNKLALNAGWDDKLLAVELSELQGMGADLELTGFSASEVNALFAKHTGGLTDPDDVPEAPENPVSRPGDIWIMGRHRIVCGDSTDPLVVEKALAGVRPHLMVTDPPYGVEYDPGWRAAAGINKNRGKMGVVQNDDRADWREAWALFPGDVAYVWHGALHATTVAESLITCGFNIRAQIIWAKDRLVMGRGHYHWQHEPAWYAVRGGGGLPAIGRGIASRQHCGTSPLAKMLAMVILPRNPSNACVARW